MAWKIMNGGKAEELYAAIDKYLSDKDVPPSKIMFRSDSVLEGIAWDYVDKDSTVNFTVQKAGWPIKYTRLEVTGDKSSRMDSLIGEAVHAYSLNTGYKIKPEGHKLSIRPIRE